mmetsp:Transcript_115197/g.306282  ORF Transcript_115197/g.306282 Transcript_115197/m.306282 type:complete len:264 (+) Transcript_115197:155-946(+)
MEASSVLDRKASVCSCSRRALARHHLGHFDRVHHLLIRWLQPLRLQQGRDGFGEPLYRVQTHALSEPPFGIGGIHLSASHCVIQGLVVVAQLQPALCPVRPDGPNGWIKLQGLRVVHGCLHEVVRSEHLVSGLALLLRALPPLLGRRSGLWLGLLRNHPGRKLHRVLALVPHNSIGQEQFLRASGVQPSANLHGAGPANRVDLAAGAAPADGQPGGVLVVDAADVVALGVANAHGRGALVDLEGPHGMVELNVDVTALVHLDR